MLSLKSKPFHKSPFWKIFIKVIQQLGTSTGVDTSKQRVIYNTCSILKAVKEFSRKDNFISRFRKFYIVLICHLLHKQCTNIARNSNIQITLELLIYKCSTSDYSTIIIYNIIYSIDIYNNFVLENG